jgi:hypothetical protein
LAHPINNVTPFIHKHGPVIDSTCQESKDVSPFIASRIKKKMMVIVPLLEFSTILRQYSPLGHGSFSNSVPPFSWSTALLVGSAALVNLIFFEGDDCLF